MAVDGIPTCKPRTYWFIPGLQVVKEKIAKKITKTRIFTLPKSNMLSTASQHTDGSYE